MDLRLWQLIGLLIFLVAIGVALGVERLVARLAEREARLYRLERSRWRPSRRLRVLAILLTGALLTYAVLPRFMPQAPASVPAAGVGTTPVRPTATPSPTPTAPATATPTATPTITPTPVPYQTPPFAALLALPDAYRQLTPTAQPNRDTALTDLAFSTDLAPNFAPAAPAERFESGVDTMYGTFRHENMVNGTVWAWVWGRDDQVIDGGSGTWAFGPDGRGYVTLASGGALADGDYALTVWVNGALYLQGTFAIGATPLVSEPLPPITVTTPLSDTAAAPAATIDDLAFATDITAGYAPIDPATTFPAGTLRVYATFRHQAMADGVPWQWAWRRDDVLIDSGSELWTYAADGFGFVRLDIGALIPGAYTLQIAHGGQTLATGSFTIPPGPGAP